MRNFQSKHDYKRCRDFEVPKSFDIARHDIRNVAAKPFARDSGGVNHSYRH
jgi:hypothetical protein